MKAKAKAKALPKAKAHAHPPASVQPVEPETSELPEDATPIMERPDGFYWQSPGLTEVGPFETYELARSSRDAVGDEVNGRSETLQAERDIGINDWFDAETGEPAEGQSPPHLEEE